MSDIFPKEALHGSLSPLGGLGGGLSGDIVHRSYKELVDKPKLNDITIEGDKTLADYGFTAISPQEIDNILFGGE